MAWASSGGYPGVVSDGAGGIIVGSIDSGRYVHLESDGTITGRGLNGSRVESLGAVFSNTALKTDGGIGAFGHNPSVAATVGGAATAGGTYTAVEQGMLEAAYTALQSIGLVT